jgi:hypothetical protein
VKAALAMREQMQDTVRGPLVAASKKTREAVSAVLAAYDQDGASAPGAARSTPEERH